MDKSAIQKFAIQARNDLIKQVKQQAYNYGIDENGFGEENTITVNGRVLLNEEVVQRRDLINAIEKYGYEEIMNKVAYTWFNRFIALRYMEVNDYLPTHVRVFSNDKGEFKPEILKNALNLDLKGLNKDKVSKLLNDPTGEEDLYRYLLLTQCNTLNDELPEMFEKMGSYEELLFPLKILSNESVIAHLVNDIEEEDFKEAVEIIGWLYQYYNTEPKADVYANLKKNIKVTKENIPAATQLFTPDWIVRYMVENSIGRLWLEGHEDNNLKSKWEYYIDEAEQTENVQAELNKIKEDYKNVKLEDIKIIDPCMGSGHILVYAFDVLVDIYESQGYSARECATLILENNLYGLDIDERAYQLAYFALMMKGRSYDRRFLTRGVKPQVYCPKGYEDGLEYGSLVHVEKLEEKPVETMEITLYDEDYEEQLNRWNFKRLLSQKYDIVITNPPYMGNRNMSVKLADYVKKYYPDSKSDLFAVFIERGNKLLENKGFLAMVTMQSWMFLSSFEKLRVKINSNDFINMAHLGARAFEEIGGEVVQTTSFVIRKSNVKEYKSTFARLVDYNSQQKKEQAFLEKNDVYLATQEKFSKLPGLPIAYWVSEKFLEAFSKGEILGDISYPKTGMTTGDNNRFLRMWYEVDFGKSYLDADDANEVINDKLKWFPYSKGGGYRRWYGLNEYFINWNNNGYEIKNNLKPNGVKVASVRSEHLYFKPLITWSAVASGKFSCRNIEKGFLFDSGGSSISIKYNKLYMLSILNSIVAQYFLDTSNATINYQPGDIAKIPIIFSKENMKNIEDRALDNISLSKTDWDAFETSWDFKKHPLINGTSIKTAFKNWENECNNRFNQLKANEEELNRIFIDIYGLQEELTPEVEEKDVTVRKADLERDIKSFISYAVGCMFGRYSLKVDGLVYAGGDFDNSKYTTFIPDADNVIPICDDEYFSDDIVNRFVEFVKVVYGEDTLEENLDFIATALKRKGDSSKDIIRSYFLNDFYNDHVKTYQKRPVYWLFDSGKKNGFKAIVYMHRYQKDLLAKVRTDYVHEQQERYSTQLDHIKDSLVSATTSEKVKLSKKESKLKDQALEIQKYEEKIKHLADRQIEIDLDDGVKNNYALFSDVLAKIKM